MSMNLMSNKRRHLYFIIGTEVKLPSSSFIASIDRTWSSLNRNELKKKKRNKNKELFVTVFCVYRQTIFDW